MIQPLEKPSGNRTKAAEKLSISHRTLYRKFNQYGIGKGVNNVET